jgi:hypothetical protein
MSFSWKGLWASIKLPVYIAGAALCLQGLHGHTADLMENLQQLEAAKEALERQLTAPVVESNGTDDAGVL